ncbi:Ig-like domain-containing protein [Pinibacter aurantiacus]|uniref:VWA domain-containing protein n=1 Tax=Pinibacter aurantiacus TaxID=2851599 RepID=A0A9E2SF69_9BACT|nr:Ig-like domain-containing protein [Pinibacter aurantiacus]MBV4360547.1 hypothetical protein [Pinibacter aurantiacus]
MPVYKYICSSEPTHVYDELTEDGFCPLCMDSGEVSILLKQLTHSPGPSLRDSQGNGVDSHMPRIAINIESPTNGANYDLGSNVSVRASVSGTNRNDIKKMVCFVDNKNIAELNHGPFTFAYSRGLEGEHTARVVAYTTSGEKYESDIVSFSIRSDVPEIGMSVLLMDASASMTEPAFKESPLTKMRLVATSAASGIFDLERLKTNANAYVAAFKFDDRVELMFVDTVANLLKKYDNDFRKFANYIYDELYKFQQGTDINKALQKGYSFINKFLQKQLPEFPVQKYKVMMQRILKFDTTSAFIPNTRVLIYTDGMQYDANSEKILLPNPFKQRPIEDLNHDILIGAFFGQEGDDGCSELKSLLSNCPIHNVPQFFLFDDPTKIGNMKFLFRMASGASGFCPKCLEKQLKQ